MKKPAARIKAEIAKLQEELKRAETREAERIGRVALKAGLGEFLIEESELLGCLEEIARKFRGKIGRSAPASQPAGAAFSPDGEA